MQLGIGPAVAAGTHSQETARIRRKTGLIGGAAGGSPCSPLSTTFEPPGGSDPSPRIEPIHTIFAGRGMWWKLRTMWISQAPALTLAFSVKSHELALSSRVRGLPAKKDAQVLRAAWSAGISSFEREARGPRGTTTHARRARRRRRSGANLELSSL